MLAVAIDRHQAIPGAGEGFAKRRGQGGAIARIFSVTDHADVAPHRQQFRRAVARPVVHHEHIGGEAQHLIEHRRHMAGLVVDRQGGEKTGHAQRLPDGE
jgi:hypothetical protein